MYMCIYIYMYTYIYIYMSHTFTCTRVCEVGAPGEVQPAHPHRGGARRHVHLRRRCVPQTVKGPACFPKRLTRTIR